MEKKLSGLLGAVAALGALGTAQAAPAPAPASANVLQATSYADLLNPIPNAAALLRVVDERSPISAEANVQLAQMHHHHHHHSHWRRPMVVIGGGRHRHHHHHHHHHRH